MSKTIYIGDIHGRDVWGEIVAKHDDADNIVFIGDYFDSFDIPAVIQLDNVKKIVEYKIKREKDSTKKVYLLIGNHDIHYWPGITGRGSTAGFQETMSFQYEHFFRENRDNFQMSVLIGNRLCTHAGVGNDFLKSVGFWKMDNADESMISDYLNELFLYKPNEFTFDGSYDRNMNGVIPSYYGDDDWQSPVWIRPKSLQRVNKNTDLKKNYIQIVGHTQQDNIDIKGKTTGGKYYYIDTLPSGEYLIDVDGEFEIGYATIVKYT